MSKNVCAICLVNEPTTVLMWPPGFEYPSPIDCCEPCKRIRENARFRAVCIYNCVEVEGEPALAWSAES